MSVLRSLPTVLTLAAVGCMPVVAADLGRDPYVPKVVGELAVGSAGFEPGVAFEWHAGDPSFMVRPEIFRNTDARLGGGVSLGWDVNSLDFLHLPERHSFTIGPRVAFHNADDYNWEVDALGIWNYDLVPSQRGRHTLEIIGTIGVLQKENDNDGEDRTVLSGSIGIGYGFQF